MIWTIVVVSALSLLAAAALVLIIVRFNQLSMARSLCDEAERQLIVELRARQALMPAFIGTLQQVATRDLSNLELALASAERAPFGPRGAAAENALTEAISEVVRLRGRLADTVADGLDGGRGNPGRGREIPGRGAATGEGIHDELDTTVALLHGQLSVLSERIIAVSRLYNANVDRYHRQRGRFLCRLFGRVFTPRERFTEADVDTPRATTRAERGTIEA